MLIRWFFKSVARFFNMLDSFIFSSEKEKITVVKPHSSSVSQLPGLRNDKFRFNNSEYDNDMQKQPESFVQKRDSKERSESCSDKESDSKLKQLRPLCEMLYPTTLRSTLPPTTRIGTVNEGTIHVPFSEASKFTEKTVGFVLPQSEPKPKPVQTKEVLLDYIIPSYRMRRGG